MDDPSPDDRFSLPHELADPSDESAEAAARGYAPSSPFGRGWIPLERDIGLPGEGGREGGRALSRGELDARLAEYGVALRPPPHPGERPGGRWAGDPPAPLGPADWEVEDGVDGPTSARPELVEGLSFTSSAAPEARTVVGAAPHLRLRQAQHERVSCIPVAPAKFTPAAQVRFLDGLATTGNVRVAARRAGVCHETAYRLRRRDAAFAALWDAGLVHARQRVASVLGDRALDGVVEDVWFRGELVGQRRRYDARLLLAHVARLDRLAEALEEAGGRYGSFAESFEAGLARLAGHAEPEGFAGAKGAFETGERRQEEAGSPRQPTRDEFVAWFTGEALEGVKRRDEDRVWAAAQDESAALYDAWAEGVPAAVDAVLAGGDGAAGEGGAAEAEAPIEYKSLEGLGPARGGAPEPRHMCHIGPRLAGEWPLESGPCEAHDAALRRGRGQAAARQVLAPAAGRGGTAMTETTPVAARALLAAALLAAALLPTAAVSQDAAPAAAAPPADPAAAAPDLTQRELVAKLDGEGLGDDGDPDGTGMARLQVDPGAGKLCYDVDYRRVAPVTAAHVHAGARGKSGAPVVPLKLDRDENIKGCAAVDRATALALIAEPGDYYVNVHTTELPGGAIRGQLGK